MPGRYAWCELRDVIGRRMTSEPRGSSNALRIGECGMTMVSTSTTHATTVSATPTLVTSASNAATSGSSSEATERGGEHSEVAPAVWARDCGGFGNYAYRNP